MELASSLPRAAFLPLRDDVVLQATANTTSPLSPQLSHQPSHNINSNFAPPQPVDKQFPIFQYTLLTAEMAPPPSASLPLTQRLTALAQTLQFAWFAGYVPHPLKICGRPHCLKRAGTNEVQALLSVSNELGR